MKKENLKKNCDTSAAVQPAHFTRHILKIIKFWQISLSTLPSTSPNKISQSVT